MIKKDLDNSIKNAYEYAHKNCHYAPCVTYPPMEDGCADCSGLVFRAMYTLGINKRARNINETIQLCELAALKQSTNINDVWRIGGVVLMRPKGDRNNVSHVYYSLGGDGINNICKYDLGSQQRIDSEQPFTNVPVNQWSDKYDFLCLYYTDTIYPDTSYMDIKEGRTARIKTDTGLYTGAGVAWRKIRTLKKDTEIIAYDAFVTNKNGNRFRYVETHDGKKGFVFGKAIDVFYFAPYMAKVCGTDGTLSVRCGAGVENAKLFELKENDIVTVWCECFDNVGNIWANVSHGKYCGFVNTYYLTQM